MYWNLTANSDEGCVLITTNRYASSLLRAAVGFLLLATVVGLARGLPARAAETAGSRQHWSAQWISHPTAPLREPITLHFKKTFEVARRPEHFVVHVSADNRFVLYLNGARMGDGPARGDVAHWRYESFDLGSMLKAGTNVLAATVWNFGVYAPIAQMSDRTAFLVEGDTAAEALVNTNVSWMVEEEPGQIVLPRAANGFNAYMAAGPGERLLAGAYDWNWLEAGSAGSSNSSGSMHSQWVHAGLALRETIYPDAGVGRSYGFTADVPWALVADTLPHMAYAKEDAGHVVRSTLADTSGFPGKPVEVPAHMHVHILLDREELTTAYPRLSFSGGKGSHITMTYAEALYDEQQHKGNRNEVGTRKALGVIDDIYPDGGALRHFEPLWWRTWRYLDIEIETDAEPVRLDGLEAYFTAYPFKVGAEFHASDPELDRIWAIGWHTAQLDAHETYMDTPYYEQLQYAGDTRIQALISYAMTDDDRLARQAMRALDDSRIPEGITASRYPSALPQYIPPFSLLWIGMVHDYYLYRPDTSFVQEMLPGTRTVLDWFASYQHADGLLGKLPWWSFMDWVQTKRDFPSYDANGESCLTTLQYIGALEDAIDLESSLGAARDADADRSRLALAKKGVMERCWDARMGLVADSPAKNTFSQHANLLAVLHDVVPKQDRPDVMRKVIGAEIGWRSRGDSPELIHASYYFRFYLARALDHAGMADEYLKTLGSWHEFLKMGFTTWPETPGNTRSDSHAWTAHPTYDLLALVAGIGPGSPGFRTVRIAPHLGALTHLDAVYPHDKGLIRVKYEVNGGETEATVDLPPGLTGVFLWKAKKLPLHDGENRLHLK